MSRDRDRTIEVLDLTLLSSPSPEPESHSRSHAPPRPTSSNGVKRESSFTSERKTKPESHRHQSSSRPPYAHSPSRGNPPTPAINPRHLEDIIHTSSHHAVKNVLVELCKLSPALAGAVVRGLAPHSPIGRNLMRTAPSHSSATTIRPKREFPNSYISTGLRQPPPPEVSAMRAGGMKREQGLGSTVGNAGSASNGKKYTCPEAILLQKDFGTPPPRRGPSTASKPYTGVTPHTAPSGGGVSHSAGPQSRNISDRTPSIKRDQSTTGNSKICIICWGTFTEATRKECPYHNGPKVVHGPPGVASWACCGQRTPDGCQRRAHVDEETMRAHNTSKRPASFYENSPFFGNYKSPRLS
ncbi:hypothetical protein BU24DRAFT_261920 [Aaosphaeria arxii CBS 175.79]|uniref:Uncharacterized protein n=1 Tax=Aaosphaeria arxii CBS 175.79 TaxID=1450172 RepID=A0A6A5XJA7_9PLEO|nr:uncharacterized protein BU24DRAFT_261920 [Aaosphaeria arxii CBS 175.79]KAF2012949.1 hypothetical protein BU24DRAFT_261920 [Aaosphaeria arxii CBS 175.79]